MLVALAVGVILGLTNYRLTTNGPGYQGVTYLHFHLTAN
jgi:hypothetical protein